MKRQEPTDFDSEQKRNFLGIPPRQELFATNVHVHLSRPLALALILLLALPWAMVANFLWRSSNSHATKALGPETQSAQLPAVNNPSATKPSYRVRKCQPGPWGNLSYTRFQIQPPDEYVTAEDITPKPIRWVFKGMTRAGVEEAWKAAGLTQAQYETLLKKGREEKTPDGLALLPPDDMVLELTSQGREKLYAFLGKFPENSWQARPAHYRAERADDWFEDCGLAPETIDLVRRLCYRRGDALLFSDFDLVLPRLSSKAESYRLVKTMGREATLMVKLHVDVNTDVKSVAEYWSVGDSPQNRQALLDSLADTPDGVDLNVSFLMPPFVRVHLYGYPVPLADPNTVRDCYWTALNFYTSPDEGNWRAFTKEQLLATLSRDYYPVPGYMKFGDIILLETLAGTPVHACNYVADNIVFTKNGLGIQHPWMLEELEDVISTYAGNASLKVTIFRRKGL